MKSKLHLGKTPTLQEIQKYEHEMELERGFDGQTVLEKCLLLGEEVGELFKSVRKNSGVKIDKNSNFKDVSEELSDILIYICSIANKYNIDLEKAFRSKEEKNKKRKWD